MPREHDRRDEDTAVRVGGEPEGDARAPGRAASEVPEDGVPAGTPAGADEPGSLPAEPPEANATQRAEEVSERRPPLITAVEIENFKGIGRPVRVELRPVTLLFGSNSVGKSTVLHALCYAHEILSHGNVDARTTELGGNQVDLGGFQRFVHGHDLKRSVRLRFELNLRHRQLPDLAGWGDTPLLEDSDLLNDAASGWLELVVKWSGERNGPIISRYEVGVDGQLVGRITEPASTGVARLGFNPKHPLLGYEVDGPGQDVAVRMAGMVRETSGSTEYGQELSSTTVLSAPASAMPSLKQLLWIRQDDAIDDLEQDIHLRTLLPGIGSLVRDELAGFRYLGPLRALHPGADIERRRPDRGGWADGSAAWDILNAQARVTLDQFTENLRNRMPSPTEVVGQVSDWLSREDRLDTGYKLHVDRIVHLPVDTPLVGVLNKRVEGEKWGAPFLAKLAEMSGDESVEEIVREKPDKVAALLERIANAPVHRKIQIVETRTGLPVRTSDIGVGISQLLPVVVAVLDPARPGFTAIEQPELHLHPRLQVELGDLFAEQAVRGGVLLIETHSEHVLLRIMKRMRQTSDGTLPDGAPEVRPKDVNVLFVELYDDQTLIREMPLNERGELVDAWPGGFFEEDLREIF